MYELLDANVDIKQINCIFQCKITPSVKFRWKEKKITCFK